MMGCLYSAGGVKAQRISRRFATASLCMEQCQVMWRRLQSSAGSPSPPAPPHLNSPLKWGRQATEVSPHLYEILVHNCFYTSRAKASWLRRRRCILGRCKERRSAWPKHTSTFDIINNLGNLYADQDKLAEAEAMYTRRCKDTKRLLA